MDHARNDNIGQPDSPESRPPQYFEKVREVLHSLTNSVSALKLYPAENPAVNESIDSLASKLTAFLAKEEKLELGVDEFSFRCEGQVVYTDLMPIKSLPFFLFKDGLYALFFYQGLDRQELVEFLNLIKRESQKTTMESDIVTAMWESDFSNIHYYAPDYYLETKVIDEARKSLGQGTDSILVDELLKENIDISVNTSNFSEGRIDLDDEDRAPGRATAAEAGSGAAAAGPDAPGDKDRSPAASMDPILSKSELAAVEDMIRFNRKLSPEEEYVDLTVELIFLESDPAAVQATLDSIYEYHLEQLEKGNFFVVILIVQKIQRLLDHLRSADPDKAKRLSAFMKKIVSPRTLEAIQSFLDKNKEVELSPLLDFFRLLGSQALSMSADLFESVGDDYLRKGIVEFTADETRSDLGLLAGLADDSRRTFSMEVIRLLEKAEAGKGIPHLAVFLNSSDKDLKIAAVAALGGSADNTANSILLGFLNDRDEDVRIQAALRLNPVTETSRINKIIREASTAVFARKSLKEKRAMFSFIGRSGTPEALQFLSRNFRRHWPLSGKARETGLAAISGLENMGGPEAMTLLEKGARSWDKRIAESCSEAIIRMSAQPARRPEQ